MSAQNISQFMKVNQPPVLKTSPMNVNSPKSVNGHDETTSPATETITEQKIVDTNPNSIK
jgi:hypothetical protein